mmetsp:Transcript_49952/g.160911  ORF Transcript_49952/g.160911 Transcript_49952/m.160911 type:complete len:121 (+) Transcript_49952:906-1268(+)
MDPAVAPSAAFGHRLLRRRSLRRLARQLEALLSSAPHRALHTYRQHDLLLRDNPAVSHRGLGARRRVAGFGPLRRREVHHPRPLETHTLSRPTATPRCTSVAALPPRHAAAPAEWSSCPG